MGENGDAAANAQAANDSQAQAAIATGTQADPTPPNESSSVSLEEHKKVQREAQSLRTRLKALDDAKAAEELAKLGELEMAGKQLEAANAQIATLKAQIASQAVQLEAAAAHFNNPAHVAKLIGDRLEYGEDGAPSNVKQLLDDLGKSDPYLKAMAEPTQQQPTRAAMSATNAGRGSSAGYTAADLLAGKKLSVEQSAQMWADGTMRKLIEEAARKQ
jgi:DNA repair exonuclease SbcCD ATPase subunit